MQRQSNRPDGTAATPKRVGRRALITGGALLGAAAGAAAITRGTAQTPGPAGSPGAGNTPGPQDGLRKQLNAAPLLLETRVERLDSIITPNAAHFVRSHNDIPRVDAKSWRLEITGAVGSSRSFSLDQLKAMPRASLTCFIECSGNSRSQFQPKTTGAPWGNGAISVAEWTGVTLKTLLEAVKLKPEAVDLVASGGDSVHVYRAIPRAKALDPDTIVAYAQNGEPLTTENGFPVRLVVPGWGGICSIKWLTNIQAVSEPFVGFYNSRYYVYETPGLPKVPVQALGVKSFITQPAADAPVAAGSAVTVSGYAYSGVGQIAKVEVSADGGSSYQPAELMQPVQRWAWVRWQYRWTAPRPGDATLRSRATDQAGNVQPETVAWNRYGYGYNAIQVVKLRVG